MPANSRWDLIQGLNGYRSNIQIQQIGTITMDFEEMK
jgi:hypothetical protein